MWESPSAPLAQVPQHTFAALPLSVRNVSKASQPVFADLAQLRALRERLPSGVFIMYHHQLGLITDATAEHYGVPGLVLAHVGLPYSHVAQVGMVGCTRAVSIGSTCCCAWDM